MDLSRCWLRVQGINSYKHALLLLQTVRSRETLLVYQKSSITIFNPLTTRKNMLLDMDALNEDKSEEEWRTLLLKLRCDFTNFVCLWDTSQLNPYKEPRLVFKAE